MPYDVTDHYNSENWSLSKTPEYAYDDYCIARMAEKLGEKQIADEFYKRSLNYKNVYNSQTTFMQPRNNKGSFIEDFSPMIILRIFAKVMVGNISGLCNKTLMD